MKNLVTVLGGLALAGAALLVQAQTPPAAPAAPSATNPATVSAPTPTPAAGTPAPAPAAAAKADLQAGFVKSVRGSVQLLNGAGAARTASPGDPLGAVDRIVTGPDSSASVVLRDDTTLVVGPSSRLDLKEFHFDGTTRDGGILLSLLRGSMRMITGLIGKTNPDAIRVETQTATIGIRGTDFIVQADGQP
ncbi:FecR domain-containing protein [Variovorax sp. CAN2819]|uniref:FecR family protein n=1 Tax=Variovorax sp. CAN15 TaxID=3046727 RepID=UPI002647BCE7|nr:FecR domain-containing protein [Variovorax sp. CAN15]MDN6883777.1 FecR domain-containing protein [Variovorax sp. CAN15]